MVVVSEDKIYFKIIYWGMVGSGKTTILDTLYELTKTQEKGIVPVGDLTKISKASGATLYFDRGVFNSREQQQIFYWTYTVAGQNSFFPLRKKVFEGTDGVIFVVNSQHEYLEDNIQSLKELKIVSNNRLIKELPLIVMLNKQDLTDTIGKEDFKQILKDEKIFYEKYEELYFWNPRLINSCGLYKTQKNVYRGFIECVKRVNLYYTYGNGKAPINVKSINRLNNLKHQAVN